MVQILEVVVTAPDAEWLSGFTRRLVEDRLVAGAHQVELIRAIYRWQGEIRDHPESRVALHTTAACLDLIIQRAQAEHPYAVPCVIAAEIADGNPDYLAWVLRETRRDVEGLDKSTAARTT